MFETPGSETSTDILAELARLGETRCNGALPMQRLLPVAAYPGTRCPRRLPNVAAARHSRPGRPVCGALLAFAVDKGTGVERMSAVRASELSHSILS